MIRFFALTSVTLAAALSAAANDIYLDLLDFSPMVQEGGTAQHCRSFGKHALSIAGQTYEKGIGAHAYSELNIRLDGAATRFSALVGVDDEGHGKGSVTFEVLTDGTPAWNSGVMRGGEAAKPVEVALAGVKTLRLVVKSAGEDGRRDNADWVNARIEYTGATPETFFERGEMYLLTPPAKPEPRINGARVFGVRPGHPFLYTIAATGDAPLTFAAENLPEGLTLDAATGRITGTLDAPGTHHVTLIARNARGEAKRELRIEAGEAIALTPPLGWNSWNCWAQNVDDGKVRATAKAMYDAGLAAHGWTYINIDDTWQGARTGADHALQSNEKFPDMKALSEYVHGLGLKLGTYSTPWITSYASFAGGSSDDPAGAWSPSMKQEKRMGKYPFDDADARQWAAWGIDYLKYDWNPNDIVSVERMAKALRGSGRDVVFSLSNSAPFQYATDWARLANAWRTTGDIRDSWESLRGIWQRHVRWQPYTGPGHWSDPDMLVVGKVGWGELHDAYLTADEQYTHISLWCLWAAPLLIGCPIETLDAFTLNLLTNDEVLDVNQDPLGEQANQIVRTKEEEIFVKNLEDGSKAIGLFNVTPVDREITLQWNDAGLAGKQRLRDLWRQQDLGEFENTYTVKVRPHGVVLVRAYEIGK